MMNEKNVGTENSLLCKACELCYGCDVGYQCHTNYGVGDQFTIECTCTMYTIPKYITPWREITQHWPDVSSLNCRTWSRSAFTLVFLSLRGISSHSDLAMKGGRKGGSDPDPDRVHTSRWPPFDRPFEIRSSFDPPSRIKCEHGVGIRETKMPLLHKLCVFRCLILIPQPLILRSRNQIQIF